MLGYSFFELVAGLDVDSLAFDVTSDSDCFASTTASAVETEGSCS